MEAATRVGPQDTSCCLPLSIPPGADPASFLHHLDHRIARPDNDAEIQDIRKAQEALLVTTQAGDSESLPGKGDTLKSDFIKVYLNRG